MNWISGRYGWLLPVLALVLVLTGTYIVDRERGGRADAHERAYQADAQRRADLLADRLSNAASARLGALAPTTLRVAGVHDSSSAQAFQAALDSLTGRLPGLQGVEVIYPLPTFQPLRQRPPIVRELAGDTALGAPYARALATRRPAATGALDPGGRRLVIFDPVVPPAGPQVLAVLAAEIDPLALVRLVLTAADSLHGSFYAVYGPNGVRLTANTLPRSWPSVLQPVRVADRTWQVQLAYPPPDGLELQTERAATWAVGGLLALMLALVLYLSRRAVLLQQGELARREAVEVAARTAAADARARAQEARALAAQLEAAQRAAQRLSTSLDPDDVVELFLGGVAETLGADVATLYTFAE